MVVHQPVMLNEVLKLLDPKPGDVVLDATVGGAGHATEILKKIMPDGLLVGIDADPEALSSAETALKSFQGRYRLIYDNFRNLDRILPKEDIKALDIVLFDIGVSSFQMDSPARGFSIKEDAPLDMRMDPQGKVTARDIINRLKERELSDIIRRYGEERYHNRIARYICEERSNKPIETTRQLAAVIYKAIGKRHGSFRIDPATRTFQAIRIAVNDELSGLEEGIKKAVEWLAPGGRIAVISFHSLEDRIVKTLFKGYAGLGVLNILTKKPVRPSAEEVSRNPRSRSGRLRAAEKGEI